MTVVPGAQRTRHQPFKEASRIPVWGETGVFLNKRANRMAGCWNARKFPRLPAIMPLNIDTQSSDETSKQALQKDLAGLRQTAALARFACGRMAQRGHRSGTLPAC